VPWLGFIKLGATSITTLPIPVTIGAVLLGWQYGLYFGVLFGVTSLVQCFTGDILGAICVDISIVRTFALCVVTRALMGALAGLLYDALRLRVKNRTLRYIIASASGPLFNTVLFVSALILLFGGNEGVTAAFGGGTKVIIVTLVTVNAVIEVIACAFIGTAVCAAADKANILRE